MRFLPVNLQSFLVELGSLDDTLALYDSLSDRPLAGIEELVPAARTLLVRCSSPEQVQPLAQAIAQRRPDSRRERDVCRVTIAVRYDGEDLAAVAEHMGISVREVISRHQAAPWKVAFTGFAPGFAYMVSCGEPWQTPRRSTPRTRIPAGSVALAGEFSGIYPQASPGGWQLIGQTSAKMWDMARSQPALLLPGAEVWFVDEKHSSPRISLAQSDATAPVPREAGERVLTILAPGLQTSWQDGGRAGQAGMGVSESGAMDKAAWRCANRIVGNPASTACLEITQGGLRARAERDLVIAITGAPCPIALTAQGQRWQMAPGKPLSLAAGDEIALGAPASGLRSYLAVRGGCAVESGLGSASWDSLAGVGPAPLKAGDVLCALPNTPLNAVLPHEGPFVALPKKGDVVTIDLIAGPRTDWFSRQALETLTGQSWLVTAQSNRIGLRLQGDQALERVQLQELPSEGTCCGAIQVPASGQPVLFLNDHPLTGGYPVIGAVAHYHLDLAGQIPPGAWIRFNLIRPFSEINGSLSCDA
ncbi:5-oxoprolinase/urea amidolyase family protein [Entomohabitans teleogrylli]|uniref:5-oxoprolinase subunit B/C family protein n=1 Tax=Entomohabitans teleogrylli TaxID=1384589 RepID=UPI00073D8B0B|nr:5-oxoprolinase/urea amidolyase family protein [Entomohabitans teleogrylli]